MWNFCTSEIPLKPNVKDKYRQDEHQKTFLQPKLFSLIPLIILTVFNAHLPVFQRIYCDVRTEYLHKKSINFSLQMSFDLICGNKMPTRCNRGFYCRSYCLLNMFRASLCPSSGAQEYYTVVAASGLQDAGLTSILQTERITLSSTPDQLLEKTTAQNTTRSNHCIILLSS